METISKRIAAAELLILRRKNEPLYLIAAMLSFLIYGVTLFFEQLAFVFIIGGFGLFAYYYMTNKQEIERLVNDYDL